MEQNKALEVLIQAVNLATKRGAFELAETEVILSAVKVFTVKPEEVKEETPVEDKKKK